MTVMLDTNVIISAGLFGSSRLSALTVRIADECNLVLSSKIIEELWKVMNEKFPAKRPVMEHFLKRLSYEIAYTPTEIDTDIVVIQSSHLRFDFLPAAARNYSTFLGFSAPSARKNPGSE